MGDDLLRRVAKTRFEVTQVGFPSIEERETWHQADLQPGISPQESGREPR